MKRRAWAPVALSRAPTPHNPGTPRRETRRDFGPKSPLLRPEWAGDGYGHATRQRPGPRWVALAIPSERGPKRENAAEVSQRRSLKTKGPVAFATGPAIDGIACESELACAQFVLFLNAPARGFPYRGHRRGCRRTQHCGASARAGPCGHHPCRTSVATNRFRRSSRHVHTVSGFGRREVSPLGSDVPRSSACTGAPRGSNCRSAIWTVSGVLLPATGATSLCGSFEPACRTGHAAGLCGGA
jgi:hypothetical protein